MSKKLKIGYTTGVFDMFHIGHLNILRNAKLECDYLIVGITSDELSKSEKNVEPIIPFNERMAIVESIKYVDMVVPQTSYDKIAAWNDLRFNIMFVGDDWKGTPKWKKLEKEFSELGVRIHYFQYTKHTSSTKLRKVVDDILSVKSKE
ncbi:MAG: adenylyltransferase/cytidyltransferase family protein [Spirochaetales bacterium]|uniref:Adenylyltransferase/cytidyltransferase family protein n=1 Tax=Candidatus Thalassospirochaeta sargassi TaxID=3119039 RepID=A0AAJ1IBD8_9SPIO|nr:adenylyltransferase/cytidyltransferase family protein [Spirochaetales bacterium]